MKKILPFLIIILLLIFNVNATFEALTFMIGKGYAMQVIGQNVDPMVLKAINFAIDPTSTVTSEALGAVSQISPELAKGLVIAQNPGEAAKQEVLQRTLTEVAKNDPQLVTAITRSMELSNYAKVAFSSKEDSKENIAEIKTDKEGNTIVKKEGKDFAKIPKGWDVKNESGKLVLTSNGEGELVIGDYKLTNSKKGSKIYYQQNKRDSSTNMKVEGETNIEIGETKLKNTKNGEFTSKDNEIIYAEFTATEKTDYTFKYSGEDIDIKANKDSKILFDRENNELNTTNTKVIIADKGFAGSQIKIKFAAEKTEFEIRDQFNKKALNTFNTLEEVNIKGPGRYSKSGDINFDKDIKISFISKRCINNKITCIESIGNYNLISATEDINLKINPSTTSETNYYRISPIKDNSLIVISNKDIFEGNTNIYISKNPLRLEGKPSNINSIIALDFIKDENICTQYIGSGGQNCQLKNNYNPNMELKKFLFNYNEAVANNCLGNFYGSKSPYASFIKKGKKLGLSDTESSYFAYIKSLDSTIEDNILTEKVKKDLSTYKPGEIGSFGVKIPEGNIEKTSCIDFIAESLENKFKGEGKIEKWNKIYEEAYEKSVAHPAGLAAFKKLQKLSPNPEAVYEPGLMGLGDGLGDGMLDVMAKREGWKGLYFNRDTKNPDDANYMEHGYGGGNGRVAKILDKNGNLKDNAEYYKLNVIDAIVDYEPSTEQKIDGKTKILPENKITKEKSDKLNILNCIPFGLVCAKGCIHTAVLSCGKIFQEHNVEGPTSSLQFDIKDFKGWGGWNSGVIVTPPGDWEKYSKNPSNSPCGC